MSGRNRSAGGNIAVTHPRNDMVPAIVIDFTRAGQASRRVAGLSVAGRQLHLCAAAGFTRIGIALPDGDGLDQAAADDVARLSPAGGVAIGSRAALARGAV